MVWKTFQKESLKLLTLHATEFFSLQLTICTKFGKISAKLGVSSECILLEVISLKVEIPQLFKLNSFSHIAEQETRE